MTLPDVADIMEHILTMLHDAKREYAACAAAYEDATARRVETLRQVYSGRCENWAGYMDALSELKRWIVTYEKEEPDRSEKDCMWEDRRWGPVRTPCSGR